MNANAYPAFDMPTQKRNAYPARTCPTTLATCQQAGGWAVVGKRGGFAWVTGIEVSRLGWPKAATLAI